MARDYNLQDKVADSDFAFPPMNSNYWSMLLSSIQFFSDEYQTQVTPSGGTVKVMLSSDGINYSSIPNGEFAAFDAYNPDRTKPNAFGQASYARLTLSGISGATHFRAVISRTA